MIGLLKRKAKFMSKVHDTYEELVEELPWRLSMVNSRRPVMIFLDGLDHLVDPDLSWIPEQVPRDHAPYSNDDYRCLPMCCLLAL